VKTHRTFQDDKSCLSVFTSRLWRSLNVLSSIWACDVSALPLLPRPTMSKGVLCACTACRKSHTRHPQTNALVNGQLVAPSTRHWHSRAEIEGERTVLSNTILATTLAGFVAADPAVTSRSHSPSFDQRFQDAPKPSNILPLDPRIASPNLQPGSVSPAPQRASFSDDGAKFVHRAIQL
jgi:hypothetical protein